MTEAVSESPFSPARKCRIGFLMKRTVNPVQAKTTNTIITWKALPSFQRCISFCIQDGWDIA